MTEPTHIARHTEFVRRMAEAVGLDLEQELMFGRLDQDELDTVISRCISCRNVPGCSDWLAVGENGPHVTPPEFCRNRKFFEQHKAAVSGTAA